MSKQDQNARTTDAAAARPDPTVSEPVLDPQAIFASIGEVPYDWRIASDVLVWGPHVADVLMIADPSTIATGRGFGQLIDPTSGQSRYDAVIRAAKVDDGAGLPYQLQYALRRAGGGLLWLEDTGRWFAGKDGKPERAHGVVRVINERYEREQRLAFLSRYDELTGHFNRPHLLATLAEALVGAKRFRRSPS